MPRRLTSCIEDDEAAIIHSVTDSEDEENPKTHPKEMYLRLRTCPTFTVEKKFKHSSLSDLVVEKVKTIL